MSSCSTRSNSSSRTHRHLRECKTTSSSITVSSSGSGRSQSSTRGKERQSSSTSSSWGGNSDSLKLRKHTSLSKKYFLPFTRHRTINKPPGRHVDYASDIGTEADASVVSAAGAKCAAPTVSTFPQVLQNIQTAEARTVQQRLVLRDAESEKEVESQKGRRRSCQQEFEGNVDTFFLSLATLVHIPLLSLQ